MYLSVQILIHVSCIFDDRHDFQNLTQISNVYIFVPVDQAWT